MFDNCLCEPLQEQDGDNNGVKVELIDMSRDPAYAFTKPQPMQ